MPREGEKMTKEQIKRRAELKAGLDAGKRYRNPYGHVCYMDMTHECGPYVLKNTVGEIYTLQHGWTWLGWEEILPEPAWQPQTGDRVIGRDGSDGEWHFSFFSHIRDNEAYPYTCVGNHWRYIAPLEGNEHLVGTKNGPAKNQIGGGE
jgi:hypothetical protein